MSNEAQRIENWGVVANDRLAGTVYNRPGHRDGGMIVTSPVVEIRILGGHAWPGARAVAFTESGSAYQLGKPSDSTAAQQARQFIYAKLAAKGGVPDRTIAVQAIVDTTVGDYEHIDVFETTFKPL